MLRQLTIRQFRGFYSKQDFRFAVPNGKNGSGITIVVGPNNAGKTTFIEALAYHTGNFAQKRFQDSERHGKLTPIIEFKTDNGVETITNVNEGSQAVRLDNVWLDTLRIEFIASRRYWQAQYSGTLSHEQFIQSSSGNLRNAGDIGTAQLIATLNLDPLQRDNLTALMKRLVPNFSFWTVGTRELGGDYIRYRTGKGIHHAVDMLGDGILSLFRICAHLVNAATNDYVLVIDEPELSLHPSAQKELHAILSEYATSKQIIIVTHSPHFIDWQDITNGARVIRLNKHDDKMCVASSLNPVGSYAHLIGNSVEDWRKPELLDTAAKEIMFSDKVLFVEGKEDVGLLRRWSVQNNVAFNFDIFGYGVGGESSMRLFMEMARDLGVRRVAALFDGNSPSYSSCVAKYPHNCIRQLSTDDIRDKVNPAKNGIFDIHGNLKSQYHAELASHINSFITFFNS